MQGAARTTWGVAGGASMCCASRPTQTREFRRSRSSTFPRVAFAWFEPSGSLPSKLKPRPLAGVFLRSSPFRLPLGLNLNVFPAELLDLGVSQRRDRTGCRKHRRRARANLTSLLVCCGNRFLLDIGPDNVVEREGRDDRPVSRRIDRLAAHGDERHEAAEFVAARRKDLRT